MASTRTFAFCIKCILIFGGNGVNIYPINSSPNRRGVHSCIADLVYYCIERVDKITFILQTLLMEIQKPVVEMIKRLKVLKCLICLNYIKNSSIQISTVKLMRLTNFCNENDKNDTSQLKNFKKYFRFIN